MRTLGGGGARGLRLGFRPTPPSGSHLRLERRRQQPRRPAPAQPRFKMRPALIARGVWILRRELQSLLLFCVWQRLQRGGAAPPGTRHSGPGRPLASRAREPARGPPKASHASLAGPRRLPRCDGGSRDRLATDCPGAAAPFRASPGKLPTPTLRRKNL